MTREEFEALRNRVKASGETLKTALKAEGIAYSTYNYWCKKLEAERQKHPIAPFPNGLKAHFGQGSETLLMEVLNRSLD